MPTYKFKCNKCKKEFEVFTSISEKDKTCCPKCKGKKLEQILGSFFMGGSGVKDTTSSNSSCGTCGSHNCSTCGTK